MNFFNFMRAAINQKSIIDVFKKAKIAFFELLESPKLIFPHCTHNFEIFQGYQKTYPLCRISFLKVAILAVGVKIEIRFG